MKKLIGILCLILTGAASVYAENKESNIERKYIYRVRGVVLDEQNLPIPGATVQLIGTTFGAGTNSNGEFVIRTDEERNCLIKVSFIGYKPKQESIKSSRNPESLIVRLEPANNEIDEVVVTGSIIEKPLKETPVITRIISQKEITALNPMSVETLLQYELPGLQIGYNSMSQLPEISYQGMEGQYMLFLLDGERISGEGADHNVDFTRFNVDDIERIEVIKGAQSTMYGSNALGGVINIITKTANRPIIATVNARYAGSNGEKYTASAGIKKSRLNTYTSLTYRTKDTYTIGDDEGKTTITENPDGSSSTNYASRLSSTIYGYNIWDFMQKAGYNFNEKLSADIKGSYYRNQRAIRAGKLYQEYYIDYSVSAKLKYLIAQQQQLTVSYINDNYKKDNHFFRIDSTYTNYRNITQTPRMDYSGTFGKHALSAGLEANLEYLKHYMLKDSSDAKNHAYSLYLQEDLKMTDNLNVIAGVRSDYHEKYKWHVTPKISVLCKTTDNITIRGGYAQGFRSPSLKELYQTYDMGGMGWFMLYGNPDLKPETSHQYSLSAEINKGGFNASASIAHNRFKNKIAYMALNDGSNDMQYVNAENAKTTSFETIVRQQMNSNIILTGAYAYTDDYTEVDGRNASNVRPHSVTINATYSRRFGKIGFNAALNGQWASGFSTYYRTQLSDGNYSYTQTRYDDRTMCSFNAGVSFPRGITVNLGIDNLLNHKDKAADSSLQVPQKGISGIVTININLADMLKL